MTKRKRSGWTIMRRLIVLIDPLKGHMGVAITAGSLSFFCAVTLSILAAVLTVKTLAGETTANIKAWLIGGMIMAILLRGLLRYLEQYMNHLIAFRVLAVLRDKVFEAVRRLAPSSLIAWNKGDLLSMIASDMELLEVFYAHTISPIAIATVTTLIYVVALAFVHPLLGLVGLLAYLVIGVLLPLVFARFANATALGLRRSVGDLNNKYLDLLRGVLEIIQFGYEKRARAKVIQTNEALSKAQRGMIAQLGTLLAWIDLLVGLLTGLLWIVGRLLGVAAPTLTVAVVGFFFSFGAVSALALLGNGLAQTLACGDRVLDLLDAKPLTLEVTDGEELKSEAMTSNDPLITIEGVTFSYGDADILKDVTLQVAPGEILGLQGASGCGKSTLLKLIMRFWTVDQGMIRIAGKDVNKVNTKSLWQQISYMTQTTEFFDGSIRDNLLIARPNATDEELYLALKKAALDTYVRHLPEQLDTKLAELGENFSGGERQRIGLARVFLKDSPILLLDEPTSNLDSLNEGIILHAIATHMRDKTVVLVSHRTSTLRICDRVVPMKDVNHV